MNLAQDDKLYESAMVAFQAAEIPRFNEVLHRTVSKAARRCPLPLLLAGDSTKAMTRLHSFCAA
jgi:hypothetical protein